MFDSLDFKRQVFQDFRDKFTYTRDSDRLVNSVTPKDQDVIDRDTIARGKGYQAKACFMYRNVIYTQYILTDDSDYYNISDIRNVLNCFIGIDKKYNRVIPHLIKIKL